MAFYDSMEGPRFARALRGLVAIACLAVLTSCHWLQDSIHPDFFQAFIDVNRRGDDRAATALFDPQLRVLAVGRESGLLELWDTRQPNSRVALKAHDARTEFIAFGPDDGIVLTASMFDSHMINPDVGPRVWDAYTGELLATLTGLNGPGPIAASPVKGLYLLAESNRLWLYDHRQRQLVGTPYEVERSGQVTAITSDRTSGLIAVGSSNGDLILLQLDLTREQPRFAVVRQIAPYGRHVRTDVLTLALLDEGRRLVSVGWLPEAERTDSQAEISEWDVSTLQRKRTYPFTLQAVNWAAATPGSPWLVLAGLESTRGKIELVDLSTGIAWRYKANTSHPRAVLFPEARAGLILQSGGATRINYLDQK
ncbi:MAG TPA: hypothetical protein VN156_06200 [Pseudomonas sp.]|nr:hypothetical protein [Pseudomonas sp.]